MDTTASAQNEFCPFLGLSDDSRSLMAYISPQNCCYRCQPVMAVKLEHQNNYCLDTTFINCQAYIDEAGKSLPAGLRYKPDRSARRSIWMRRVIGGIVIGIILLGGWFLMQKVPPNLALSETPGSPTGPASATFTAQTTATDPSRITPPTTVVPLWGTLVPTSTLTVSPFPSLTPTIFTATLTRTPTATVTKTTSPTLAPSQTPTEVPSRSLDVPIGRGRLYLIHRVSGGENLNTMAEKYQISIEAILAINYTLSTPIWADALVVIPLGVTSPEKLPVFEPYQVTENNITAEALAQQLGCDAALFKYFNDLADGEKLKKGDWFLIPRNGQK